MKTVPSANPDIKCAKPNIKELIIKKYFSFFIPSLKFLRKASSSEIGPRRPMVIKHNIG